MALKQARVDGIVLDTTFDRPHPIVYNDTQVLDYYVHIGKMVKQLVGDEIAIGINMLLFDTAASIGVAKLAGLDFVMTDIFSDTVFVPAEERHHNDSCIFIPQPELIDIFRRSIKAENIFILAGINSKFFPKINPAISMTQSIEIAMKNNADAIMVADYLEFDPKQIPLPVIVMGGVKSSDLNHIKGRFAGFSAGSLFENELGQIDENKATSIIDQWKKQ